MTDNMPLHCTEQQVGCWEFRFRDEEWHLQKPSGFDFSHPYLAWHIQLTFLRARGLYNLASRIVFPFLCDFSEFRIDHHINSNILPHLASVCQAQICLLC